MLRRTFVPRISGYALFTKEVMPTLKHAVRRERFVDLGAKWKALSADERAKFIARGKEFAAKPKAPKDPKAAKTTKAASTKTKAVKKQKDLNRKLSPYFQFVKDNYKSVEGSHKERIIAIAKLWKAKKTA